MDFPKYATVKKKVKIDYGPDDWDKDYYEREKVTKKLKFKIL